MQEKFDVVESSEKVGSETVFPNIWSNCVLTPLSAFILLSPIEDVIGQFLLQGTQRWVVDPPIKT